MLHNKIVWIGFLCLPKKWCHCILIWINTFFTHLAWLSGNDSVQYVQIWRFNSHKTLFLNKRHTQPTNLQLFPYTIATSDTTGDGLLCSNLHASSQNRMAEGAAAVSPLQGVRVQISPGCSLVGVVGSRKSNPLGLVGTLVKACLKGGSE